MLDREAGMRDGSLRQMRIMVRTKKGSQQIVNALIIMPKVVLALRSLASWSRRRFCLCGELTSLLVLLACLRCRLLAG